MGTIKGFIFGMGVAGGVGFVVLASGMFYHCMIRFSDNRLEGPPETWHMFWVVFSLILLFSVFFGTAVAVAKS